MDRISNQVADIRKRRGYSAAMLAQRAGVSRQTIYAIEANSYAPNTALALRLAAALDVNVEDMFQLAGQPSRPDLSVAVDLLQDGLKAAQPVQLCPVGTRTIAVPAAPVPAYLPASDGVFLGTRRRSVLRFRAGPVPTRLLIGGCDPALSILAAHAREAGVDVALASCNSSVALDLLRGGRIHIAGTHLPDPNLSVVRRRFPRGGIQVVTFASWQEGYIVAPKNPKRIRSAADLQRADVRIVNRERGAGSRMLLDAELKKAKVARRLLRGYERVAHGHLPAAWHVLSGLADCCVATEAAARAFGLDFVPIRSERFDLVIPEHSEHPSLVARLLDAMQRSTFRHELEVLGGYDTRQTGAQLN